MKEYYSLNTKHRKYGWKYYAESEVGDDTLLNHYIEDPDGAVIICTFDPKLYPSLKDVEAYIDDCISKRS